MSAGHTHNAQAGLTKRKAETRTATEGRIGRTADDRRGERSTAQRAPSAPSAQESLDSICRVLQEHNERILMNA